MTAPARRPDRALLIKLGVLILAGAAGAFLLFRGVNIRGLVEQGFDQIRQAGPVAFFVAMLILPACGAPMLAFTLPVVSLFGPTLGTVPVVVIALLVLTGNFTMTYALARRALRPLLEKIFARLGYKLPEMEAGDATDLLILMRVTPGVPFLAQNYLAGLANAPFGRYMFISLLVTWPQAVGFMLFGDALLHGKGKVALIGLSALAAIAVATHFVRKHYERRKKARTPTP